MENTINSILPVLQRHRKGSVLTEASEAMARVVAEVLASGKPGKVTIELTVSVASRGQNALTLTDKVSAKMPHTKRPDSFWYATPTGDLMKDDPRQKEIEFKPRVQEAPEPTSVVVPEPTQRVANA